MNKPNIVLISADQMRADAMGCAGSPVITPNIDRLAAEGDDAAVQESAASQQWMRRRA